MRESLPQLEPTQAGRIWHEPQVLPRVLAATGVLAAAVTPFVGLYLLMRAIGLVYRGAVAQLVSNSWHPGEGQFGLLPLVAGSAAAAGLGLLLAAPLGICTAIWLRFYAGRRRARIGEATLGIMAGTPSVVFGLFGTYWVLPTVGWLGGGHGQTGSLLAAAIVLAIMILPTLALFALAALRQVPEGLLRDGSALGLRHSTVVTHLALRVARPGLVGACTLALARALGEALAVEMVAGNVAAMPTSLLTPVRTLTATLVQEFEYAHGAHADALHLVALTVVALAALFTGVAMRLGNGRMNTAPEPG